jgi:hypothetical protein
LAFAVRFFAVRFFAVRFFAVRFFAVRFFDTGFAPLAAPISAMRAFTSLRIRLAGGGLPMGKRIAPLLVS